MQTLIKVKEKADTVEKYSIEDIEPLIKDIIDLYKGATEQWICKTLDYNEGYISQMRSREKKEKSPQVPIKFYNQLKNFGLHYATSGKNESLGEIKVEEPIIEYVENKKRSADYLAGRLDGKDDEIKQIEARRRDMELRAEKAEKENGRLLNIIEKNLTELLKVSLHLSSNLAEVKQDTSLGLAYQRTWVEYTAEQAAEKEISLPERKKKKDQAVLHMNTLLRSQIDGGRKEGKHSDARRQHKEGQ